MNGAIWLLISDLSPWQRLKILSGAHLLPGSNIFVYTKLMSSYDFHCYKVIPVKHIYTLINEFCFSPAQVSFPLSIVTLALLLISIIILGQLSGSRLYQNKPLKLLDPVRILLHYHKRLCFRYQRHDCLDNSKSQIQPLPSSSQPLDLAKTAGTVLNVLGLHLKKKHVFNIESDL